MIARTTTSSYQKISEPEKLTERENLSYRAFLYSQILFLAALLFGFCLSEVNAQVNSISPGEAFATRFSGTLDIIDEAGNKTKIIDEAGVVGSVVDIRSPQRPALSEHWIDEPQHTPVFAKDVGQIFGIAFDNANPPNIFLTATAAFGLHRDSGGASWMQGMWGISASPGTVYRLNAKNNYQPEVFAEIELDGRRNTGASLGNIAFDATNNQLFVSDLETGMIHRLNAENGQQLSVFDHGLSGRASFMDASTGTPSSLPPESFNYATAARTQDCEADFSTSPDCWNIAHHKRRIWGLGVYAGGESGGARLYYATWGTAPFADKDWVQNSDDALNWVWSAGLTQTGDIDPADIRREFAIPEATEGSDSLAPAISDIAFSRTGQMLLAERGSMRNLGLGQENAFADPNHARMLRFRLDDTGLWIIDGRYDIGNKSNGSVQGGIYANSSGGVDWGYGYDKNNVVDLGQPDKYVWTTGNSLCSPTEPCFDSSSNSFTDTDNVMGLEGVSSEIISPLATSEAPPSGPERRYKIDLDLNIDGFDRIDSVLAARNDNTKPGDIEIYKVAGEKLTIIPVHSQAFSHSRIGSHAKARSHYRSSSHDINRSHWRYGSHERRESHYRLWSHNRRLSHTKYRSHNRKRSHAKFGSHNKYRSHARFGSHGKKRSHLRRGSHNKKRSHRRRGSHNKKRSHRRIGSHDKYLSHARSGSHSKKRSHARKGSHNKKRTHARIGSHDRKLSHGRTTTHFKKRSHARKGSHSKKRTHARKGSHDRKLSHGRTTTHLKRRSHARKGSHSKARSHARKGSHSKARSHARKGSHSKARSHARKGSHSKTRSHARVGSHSRKQSRIRLHSRSRSNIRRVPKNRIVN